MSLLECTRLWATSGEQEGSLVLCVRRPVGHPAWELCMCMQAADHAITLLYCVTTDMPSSGGQHDQAKLERKLWQAISEVQYISGRLLLNDITRPPSERVTACVQQLKQILMTNECHPGAEFVSCSLMAHTLKLYGKCAMQLGDMDKAEEHYTRLRFLLAVRRLNINGTCWYSFIALCIDCVEPVAETCTRAGGASEQAAGCRGSRS
jgi:hypothetical protein